MTKVGFLSTGWLPDNETREKSTLPTTQNWLQGYFSTPEFNYLLLHHQRLRTHFWKRPQVFSERLLSNIDRTWTERIHSPSMLNTCQPTTENNTRTHTPQIKDVSQIQNAFSIEPRVRAPTYHTWECSYLLPAAHLKEYTYCFLIFSHSKQKFR